LSTKENYNNRSIFLCTYIFEIDLSTKKITSKIKRKVEGVVAKGKDVEALKNDVYAVKSAWSKLKTKEKKWRVYDVIIEKYLGQSFVD